jgi:non-ribosomal peptide synthetase component E (peptide arylation enzyme)
LLDEYQDSRRITGNVRTLQVSLPGGFLWRSSPDAGDVGYYRGEEENPWTFNEIDAGRYSICGERALIEADGMLNGLGRVSICIDDVGEQAYPEEVEDSVQPPDDVMNSL